MKAKLLFIPILFLIAFFSQAQAPTDVIVFDKNVKTGKLANGLTYYIRKNSKPENRVELRLVVNAGSAQERDDQQGVAHFLEHMAFNGTKNFPKNELTSYLQKAGVRFGADLNASTSFDNTVYMLPISTNDETILKNGYQVLRDWAGNMLLEADEIEKERGIILEEKRMRQNAGLRTFSQFLPALTNNSIYGNRIPIGKEEIIKTAPRKAFVDFYKAWYRPNNMAVIAVGDIDVAKTEAKIKALFGDLKNPAGAPVRTTVPINWHTTSNAKIVTDAENTNNTISIYFGLDASKPVKTWTASRNDYLNGVIASLFDGRLEENFVNPKSPISFAGISQKEDFLIFKQYQSSGVFALIKDDPAAAIQMMVGEVLKAKQFGFTQAELDRVKKNIIKQYEERLAEKDKTESEQYTQAYINHFLSKEPVPGIEAEQKFVAKFLDALTLAEVNSYIKTFNLDKPSFIVLSAKDALKGKFTEKELLEAFEKAKQQKVEAYVEKKVSSQLMTTIPVPGKIVKTELNTDFDSKILTLSNGITVIYKKTTFKNDEIFMRGSQWGGNTNLSADEIKTAKYFQLVSSMGLGNNKAVDMPKVMTGVQANASLNVLPTQLLLNGNASAKDLEKLMQVIHLLFTNVNFNEAEFEGMKTNFAAQVGGLLKNPNFKFIDTLNKFKYNNSNRISGFPLEEELKILPMKALKDLHAKVTGNLNGMVIIFTGNIDEASFTSLVEQYIASVPTQQQPVTLAPENMLKPISGKNSFTFKGGKENKSEINYTYYGNTTAATDKEILAFQLMGEILQMQATKKLREEMGNTYSPRVNASVQRPPVGDYSVGLFVSSAPENADKVTAAFDDLLKAIINGTVTDDDLQKAKAQRIKVMETQMKTNPFWGSILEQQFLYGFDAKNIISYTQKVEEITKEDIVTVAKKYLSNCSVLKGIMNPE